MQTEANTGRPFEESSTPRVDRSRAKLIWKGIRELKEAVRVLWEDLCPSGNDPSSKDLLELKLSCGPRNDPRAHGCCS